MFNLIPISKDIGYIIIKVEFEMWVSRGLQPRPTVIYM